MCGIIGYIGKNNDLKMGLEALKRLEYRGYDSAGAAFYDARRKDIRIYKAVGRVSELEKKMAKGAFASRNIGEVGPFIFHTRWATHGAPSIKNAHPHGDCTRSFYVAHNGIIENHNELRRWLNTQAKNKKHKFYSDTDTEVLAHLIEHFYRAESPGGDYAAGEGDLTAAVKKALSKVVGAYGIVVISKYHPNELIAARLGSPLLLGVGDGEYFVASDSAGVLAHTKQVVYLKDGEVAKLSPNGFTIEDSQGEKEPELEELEWNLEDAQRGGYPHFMLKEIMEQPASIRDTIRGRTTKLREVGKLGGLEDKRERLSSIKKIHIVACGTAYYAGLVGKYMLEEYAGIPCEVDIGSEFRYRKPILDKDTAFLAISQSGETADTLASLREAKQKGILTLGIINVVGSAIARETDAGVYNHAGPEIGVASTKAFTSQMTALAFLTVFLGRQRAMSHTMGERIIGEIEFLPKYISKTLKQEKEIKRIAGKHKNARDFIFLGRKYNYPVALEGALKLKEISYIHAEGYAGGELKHGPIAMIDKSFPTVAIMPKDSVYEKMVSNIEEIKARGGPVIAVTTQNNRAISSLTKDVIYIPKTLEMLTPIIAAVPLQLFAYYMGVSKGYNVDKPRNLAKSVTVE